MVRVLEKVRLSSKPLSNSLLSNKPLFFLRDCTRHPVHSSLATNLSTTPQLHVNVLAAVQLEWHLYAELQQALRIPTGVSTYFSFVRGKDHEVLAPTLTAWYSLTCTGVAVLGETKDEPAVKRED